MTGARPGRFIVLEGIDGAGTTTQAKRLAEVLESRGTSVRLTREPTGGPIGALLRRALQKKIPDDAGAAPRVFDWSTLALLFAADRLDHLDNVVKPALAAGVTVVSDRYDLSSLAYQSVTAPGGAGVLPWIRELNSHAIRPDLTLVFDVDPGVAEARRIARGGPPEMFEVTEIQRRLATVYRTAERLVPGDRVVHVQDGTPDEVAARILTAVFAD